MLINSDRSGMKEINPYSSMREQAALKVLTLKEQAKFADSDDRLDSAIAELVAYHDGDEDAARATLAKVAKLREKGKK